MTEAWLREHYLDKGMDSTQIAHIVHRDPKSVWNWLKDFGIPTRPRGYDTSKLPKGRPPGFHLSDAHKARIREIAIATGRVPYKPEVGSYMKGRKGADTPGWKGGITPERQALYSSPEWSAAVKTIWKRDNATCQRCNLRKRNARKVPFDIHHIASFQNVALRAEVSNLVLLCEPCHYWVHSRNNKEKEFIKT